MRRLAASDLVKEGALRVEDGNHGNDRPRSEEFVEEGVSFIRAADMTSGTVDFGGAGKINKAARQRIRKGVGRPGDVLLSHKGTVGRVAVAPENSPEFVCSPQTTFWRSIDQEILDQRFLRYILRSADFQRQLGTLANKTDMAPYVSLTDQRSMDIVLPAIGQQRAVSEVLGALDDKIAVNERIRTCALALARTTFERDLGGVEVSHMTLGDMSGHGWLRLGDGYRTKGSEYSWPGLRILRAGDVQPDRIVATGQDFVSYGYVKPIGAKASQAGDVVVTTKGTVGRVAVVPEGVEQFVYSPQLCFFRVLDHEWLDRGFLSGWFRSADFQLQSESRMYKSDMAPYVNLNDIRSMVFPLPASLVDQRRIGETQAFLERLAHSADRENERLAATRDELLPLLMAGKVCVKDAEKGVEEAI